MGNLYPSTNCKTQNFLINNEYLNNKSSIKNISIQMSNISNYYIDIFNTLSDHSNSKILAKNYREASIKIFYDNGIECDYLAQIRIHGGKKDHIDVSSSNLNWNNKKIINLDYNILSSLRVKILNGHIYNMNDFILFIPKTRENDNEIFLSSLFSQLGFLSPRTFYTNLSFYNFKRKVIFQEAPNKNFLQSHNRKNGPILAGNRITIWGNQIYNQAALSRIKNYGGLDIGLEEHRQIILKSMSKLNESLLILRNYVNLKNEQQKAEPIGNINFIYPYLSYLYQYDKIGYNNMSAYEALMIATGSIAGLSSEDRRYYYDAVNDRFEPIYYDGMSRILDEEFNLLNELEVSYNFIYSKYLFDGVIHALDILSNISIVDFNRLLKNNGINQSLKQTDKYLKKITLNLNYIKKKTFYSLDRNLDNNTHIIKKINNLKLIFGGKDLSFEICDINITNCVFEKYDDGKFNTLIKNQIFKDKDNFYRYISLNKNNYLSRKLSENTGLKSFKFTKISNKTKVYYNRDQIIQIDKHKKVINITDFKANDRIIIKDGALKNWKINFSGQNLDFVDYKSDENNLSGCINFSDIILENISIYGEYFACPDAINFHNSKVTIDRLFINETALDGLDADFSDIKASIIEIKNVGNDCIGLKAGNFNFNFINVSNCHDKAISGGDLAFVNIKDISIDNSTYGIYAKNSSEISVDEIKVKNVQYCIYAERKESHYSGSLVKIKKHKINCNNKSIIIDKDSYLLSS